MLWDRVVDEVGADFPDVRVERMLVDAMAARMVLRPDTIDVVVASNLFGDISPIWVPRFRVRSVWAPPATSTRSGRWPSVFEPVHGSAPDIAGQGLANPLGAIWSGAMMLRHLGDESGTSRIEQAMADVCRDGKHLTADLGGHASTTEVTDAVLLALATPDGEA